MCKPALSYVLVQWLMTIEALAKYGDNDLLTISNFKSSILEMANFLSYYLYLLLQWEMTKLVIAMY